MKEIREPEDVTEANIEEAVEMRQGIYGGVPLSWEDVIYRLETSDEDWGSSMESPAIKHLQKEVRRRIREQE
jgi:hypothetical protein